MIVFSFKPNDLISKLLKDNYGIKEIMINDANSIAMTDEWTKYFRDNKLS